MRQDQVAAVILAAGKSTRMKSKVNKLLLDFGGKPVVKRVAEACAGAGIKRIIVVMGSEAEAIRSALGDSLEYAVQEEPLGTGHALMQTRPLLKNFTGDVVVVVGDHPFLTSESIIQLIEHHKRKGAAATFQTAIYPQPPASGRIIRDHDGNVLRVVEEKDATPGEAQIKEVNLSHYCFKAPIVLPLLNELDCHNAQGEYLLTDIIAILLKHHHSVEALLVEDTKVGIGINNQYDLAKAFQVIRDDYLKQLMLSGVTIIDPNATFIDTTVQIGRDTIIYPYSYLEKGTIIGTNCAIGPQVKLSEARIEDDARVEFAVIENAMVRQGTKIGPFVYIRGGEME